VIKNLSDLTYQPITAKESAMLTAFLEQPDGGRIAFHPKFVQPAHLDFVGEGKIGVVVRDGTQIVGVGGAKLLGTAVPRRTQKQIVYIHSIAVSPSHRSNGVGTTIMQELMRQAAKWGNDLCFMAHIQEGNKSSRMLFEKYDSYFFPNQQTVLVPLKRLNVPIRGNIEPYTANLSLPHDIIHSFYADYQLFPGEQSVEQWQFKKSTRKTLIYRNECNEIVAGLNVSESFHEKLLVISKLPRVGDMANRIFKFLPEDRVIRTIAISDSWCKAGEHASLRQLLAYAAQQYGEDANFAAVTLANRTIAPKQLGIKWWMLKTMLTTVILGKENVDEGDRPLIWNM
jgi:GNAT superfamily N-acetyltransferase